MTSVLLSHILGCPRDILSGNNFMSHIWVAQGPEEIIILPVYSQVLSEMKKDLVIGICQSWSKKGT